MTRRALAAALLLAAAAGCARVPRAGMSRAIKVLIVTGGHGFKPEPFFKMFADDPGLVTTAVTQGQAAEAYDRTDLASYDVVVLYDSPSDITPAQQASFLALLERGTGLVVLHHALLSYQRWPEYERVVGGKYLLDPETHGAEVTPESTYKPRVTFPVTVVAPAHAVTAGLAAFTLTDELYIGVRMRPDITPLLATGDELLAWACVRGRSRVVATVLGHGPSAYEDPNFRRFLAQSLRWTARRR
jgi:type 1 glutamine amidotransferase